MEDRRYFTRIVFSNPVKLSLPSGETQWQSSLIDLSLKGALVQKPENWQDNKVSSLNVTFSLAGSDIELKMATQIIHEKSDHLGLLCEQIDIESATHLKRLIELNVGDDALLNRELDVLVHPD